MDNIGGQEGETTKLQQQRQEPPSKQEEEGSAEEKGVRPEEEERTSEDVDDHAPPPPRPPHLPVAYAAVVEEEEKKNVERAHFEHEKPRDDNDAGAATTGAVVDDTVTNDKDVVNHKSAYDVDSTVGPTAAPAASSSGDGSTTTASSSWYYLFVQQVLALVWKNGLMKMRTPVASCMEILSPVLLVLILVAAHQMSEITYEPSRTFDTVSVDLPGPWFQLLHETLSARTGGVGLLDAWLGGGAITSSAPEMQKKQGDENGSGSSSSSDRRLLFSPSKKGGKKDVTKDEEEEEVASMSDILEWMQKTTARSSTAASGGGGGGRRVKNRFLQQQQQQEQETTASTSNNGTSSITAEDDDDDDDDGDDDDMYRVLNDLRDPLRRLLQQPLQIPTFDQYVGIRQLLASMLNAEETMPKIFSQSRFGRSWGNLLTAGGVLHLSPANSPHAAGFWNYLNDTYPLLMHHDQQIVRIHDTEQDAIRYIRRHVDEERTWALIDMSQWKQDGNSNDDQQAVQHERVAYKIRMNSTTLPHTSEITNWVAAGLDTRYQRYFLSGYLTLQRTLNEYAFSVSKDNGASSTSDESAAPPPFSCPAMAQNTSSALHNVWSMVMPIAAYEQNAFYLAVGSLLGLVIVMSYMYPTSRLIQTMVQEKELRIRERLFMAGVSRAAHGWSWFVTALFTFTVIAVLVTWTLTSAVFSYSSSGLILIWIWFFSTASIGFCFVVGTLFGKAKLAAIMGPMLLFATVLPRFVFFGSNRYQAVTWKKLTSLFPATAFCLGADILAEYEYAEQGIQPWNANQGDYSFATSVAFLFLDTALYFALAWYLEQVLPRKYGTPPQKWYFVISPTYWCKWCLGDCRRKPKQEEQQRVTQLLEGGDAGGKDQQLEKGGDFGGGDDHEVISDPSLIPRVQIQDLVKRYGRSKRYKSKDAEEEDEDTAITIPPAAAVNKLNLTLYESQITALLGHNGAGKTSTVAILTGLYPPTAGQVSIYGNDIERDLVKVRRSMGICPQENILLDHLTVLEHITLFRQVQGLRNNNSYNGSSNNNNRRGDKQDAAAAKGIAKELGLEEFYYTTAAALSGGNKRKLCLACALCHEPRFVVLDEPTAGMDPASRRACWEALRSYKKKRRNKGVTILLTTHFMDEAELLSDRIAVMRRGVLQCSGSPLFLKRKYGLGYNFTVVMEPVVNGNKNNNNNNMSSSGMTTTTTTVTRKSATTGIKDDVEQQQQGGEDDLQLQDVNITNGDDDEGEQRQQEQGDEDDAGAGQQQADRRARLLEFFREYIPGAELGRVFGKEVTFRFPAGSEAAFPKAFDAFELHAREAFGIGAFGLEQASLEEVFLRLAEQDEDEEQEFLEAEAATDVAENKAGAYDHKGANGESSSSSLSSAVAKSQPDAATAAAAAADAHEETAEVELKHLSPFKQVSLLYWKRWIIQKRDKKSICFALVVPVLLVALVLVILMVRIPIVGPAIQMSPTLYTTGWDSSDKTDVVVGGGAGLIADDNAEPGNDAAASVDRTAISNAEIVVADRVKSFESVWHEAYPDVQFQYMPEKLTSKALSEYLLESYNDHDHHVRYGAFAVHDEIDVTVKMDWNAVLRDVTAMIESIRDVEPIQVLELALGYGDGLLFNWTVAELADDFYSSTGIKPGATMDANTAQNLTQSALQAIFASAPEDVKANITAWTDEIRQWVNDPAFSAETLNSSTWLTSLVEDFVSNMTSLANNTSSWETYPNVTMEQLIDDFFGNVTAWVNTTGTANETFASFLNSTAAMQELVENAIGNVTDWANQTFFGIFNQTMDLYSSLNATAWVDSAVSGLEGEFGPSLSWFDGGIVRDQFRQALVGLLLPMSDHEQQVLDAIDEFLHVVEHAQDVSAVTNVALVGSLVAMDAALQEMISQNATASVGPSDAFESLNAALGGGSTASSRLDGYFLVKVASVKLVPETASFVVSGIQVQSASDVWVNIEDQTWSLNVTKEDLERWILPQDGDGNDDRRPEQYSFTIPSEASILHNSSSPHAVAAFHQAYTEYLFKMCTGNDAASLVSINHPLPMTTQQSVEIRTWLSVFAAMFILVPFCYIPGAFIVFLVKERSCKSKHLQLVSGVSMTAYWVASYLFDITLYLVLTVLVMMVFLMYGSDSAVVFVGDVESFFCTTALTFGYGLSVLPFSYLLARRFNNHSSAQIAAMGLTFISGFVAVNAYYIMSSIEKTEHIAKGLRPLFRTWPAYNVGEGLIQMSSAYWTREIMGDDQRPFDWDVAGKSVALLYLLSIPYFVLLLLLEYSHDGGAGGLIGRLLRSVRGLGERAVLRWHGVRKSRDVLLLDDGLDDRQDPDEDVEEERVRVLGQKEALTRSSPVVISNLWKIYPPSVGLFGVMMSYVRRCFASVFCWCCRRRRNKSSKQLADEEEKRRAFLPKRAVRGVTTAVGGEIFGLLGQNGAGKTSVIRMLTGDESATSGDICVAGHDVTGKEPNGVTKARKHIGFCPQEDPLLELMTTRETLRMFALLRGIPTDRVESEVSRLLDRLTLTPHADKNCERLSGGGKRKLSLGVALIGNPKVLLIDESSSGLDPVAKRKLWTLISAVSRNRSVILTTHSMQEAEALCSRAGIMSAGQLLCLGSVQHLKTKYLGGYTVDVFCFSGSSEDQVNAVEAELVSNVLMGSRVAERHGRFLRLEVPSLTSGLGTTFRHLEAMKQDHLWHVENYAITQCSLEQVFIKLVNQNGDDAASDTQSTNPSTDEEGNGSTTSGGSSVTPSGGAV